MKKVKPEYINVFKAGEICIVHSPWNKEAIEDLNQILDACGFPKTNGSSNFYFCYPGCQWESREVASSVPNMAMATLNVFFTSKVEQVEQNGLLIF